MKKNQENEATDKASLATFTEAIAAAPELAAPVTEALAPAVAEKPATPERFTPAQWAERKGIAPKADPARPWIEPISKNPHYHATDVLHGWSNHAYHYQAEADALLLTEEDFDLALAAGAAFPALPAHMPAVAKSCPFRDEHEARAKSEAEAAAAAKDKS